MRCDTSNPGGRNILEQCMGSVPTQHSEKFWYVEICSCNSSLVIYQGLGGGEFTMLSTCPPSCSSWMFIPLYSDKWGQQLIGWTWILMVIPDRTKLLWFFRLLTLLISGDTAKKEAIVSTGFPLHPSSTLIHNSYITLQYNTYTFLTLQLHIILQWGLPKKGSQFRLYPLYSQLQ